MSLHRRLLLVVLTLGLGAGCAALDMKQSEWIFRPVKENWRGMQGTPEGTREVWLEVPGSADERVHAWWAPQPDPQAPAILYLHGARWNLSGSSFRIQRWRDMGFSVLAIDYRGFGRSSGELPTEAKAYEDARLGWAWLRQQVPEARRRYIYGHSLGGAVAIDLAAQVGPGDAAGLITESTFTSVPDVVAASRFGWMPVGLLITQRFEALERMRRVAIPTLIMHGTADSVIPHAMADELYRAASEPKRLVKFEGASHSGIAWAAYDRYREAVGEFVRVAGAIPRREHAAR
ncbi:MAG: alpha/beta fold hydrolase [Burkholderiales bacterium]|nr:alpha/beta fold hydrolase [Burkholderiales bacterium]